MFGVRVRFLLFYSELVTTDPLTTDSELIPTNMHLTLLGQKKYEEAMSDEYPPNQSMC